jgi:membrane-associated protease RseP (regulator of RpoE activity)
MRVTLILAFAAALVGCASGYEQFYYPSPQFDARRVLPPAGSPQIFAAGSNINSDMSRLLEDGYVMIGYSSFNGPMAGPKEVIEQAKKVRADLVLVSSSFTHTVSGNITIPVYNPGQTVVSHTSGTASAYGSGGYASGTYQGTTTTTLPGSTTYYSSPYNVQRFDQSASYWARVDPRTIRLGAYYDDLTPELRQRLQRNQGALVTVVVKNTPAFRANFLAGDVITALDGVQVDGAQHFASLLDQFGGKVVTVEFMRDGQPRSARVQLNSGM